MKHLEDTPWWICDKGDENYCAYVDTDSNYFHAEPLLRHRHSNFDEMSDKERDEALEVIALEYQDIITDHYDILTKEAFNVYKFPWFEDREKDHWLEMKTECVIRSAYFRATRRYAQWITKQEGIEKETLDIKGLEFKKSNFPPVLGKFFKEVLIDVLKGTQQEEIYQRVKEFKKEILNGEIPLTELGNPTSVKTLNKYTERKARAGEMFSSPAKGAPASVKATIAYNDLIRFWNLNGKHSYITQGDKVKWIYLKPNTYQIEALAFLEFDLPDKIKDFLDEYADTKKVFESILLNKLEGFFSDLSWHLNLNENIDKFFEF
jgi:DNA polymerase elongation subunit (family B)